MPALPTRKTSKSRHGKHASHLALKLRAATACPRCHNPKLPHHVCHTCGYYNGRDVLEKEGAEAGGN